MNALVARISLLCATVCAAMALLLTTGAGAKTAFGQLTGPTMLAGSVILGVSAARYRPSSIGPSLLVAAFCSRVLALIAGPGAGPTRALGALGWCFICLLWVIVWHHVLMPATVRSDNEKRQT